MTKPQLQSLITKVLEKVSPLIISGSWVLNKSINPCWEKEMRILRRLPNRCSCYWAEGLQQQTRSLLCNSEPKSIMTKHTKITPTTTSEIMPLKWEVDTSNQFGLYEWVSFQIVLGCLDSHFRYGSSGARWVYKSIQYACRLHSKFDGQKKKRQDWIVYFLVSKKSQSMYLLCISA